MHDGLGFLTSHMALTLAFEAALQAVRPQSSVPFWDFTIDSARLADGKWSSLSASPMWQDDWFGEADAHVEERDAAARAAADDDAAAAEEEGGGEADRRALRATKAETAARAEEAAERRAERLRLGGVARSDEQKHLYTVTAGRWAFLEVDHGHGVWNRTYHNSYGYLRAPWNNNRRR